MSEDAVSLKEIAEPRGLKPVPGVVVGYRRVRSKKVWGFLTISLIILFLGLALIVSPPMSSKVEANIDYKLQPQYYFHPWFTLKKGEKLEVRGTVNGGNNDIWIYVKEGGRKIKDFGLVESPVHVIFTAPEEGNYTLYIDNTISLVTPKVLHLEILKYYYDYTVGGLLFSIGIVWVIVGLIAVGVGQKRLVLSVGGETYEFWPAGGWKFGVAVNGVVLDAKIKVGEKFRIGPNDEHVLEIKKLSWRKAGFFVDGQEVGRLP